MTYSQPGTAFQSDEDTYKLIKREMIEPTKVPVSEVDEREDFPPFLVKNLYEIMMNLEAVIIIKGAFCPIISD